MPIYKPSELMRFLENLGIRPRKGLSQNFLIDGNILRKIVKTADVQPEDLVLEIGPGPGSLTELLLEKGARVIAVEKDEILAEALKRFEESNRLTIHCDDIMTFPLLDTLEKMSPGKKVKVIANLPYHLTTPILALLVPLFPLISSLTLMVQDEVAKRFAAKPKTPEYSSFTVFLDFYSTVTYGFKVGRNCFFPAPKVDSAIVRLDLHEPVLQDNADSFFRLTRTAFQQRRKMLRASLKDLYTSEKVTDALLELQIDPKARPEDLSLAQLLSLFKTLCLQTTL